MITDAYFYFVAVPAVLLVGISKSGFGAGFGSMAVPLMALAVPVPQAAAILMPVLLAIDLLGLRAFRGHYDWTLLKFMLPWGLAGIVVGALSFKLLDGRLVAGIVGLFTLAFLAQRLAFPPRPDSPPPPRWLGRILLTTSGFTSFVAHAGAPPVNAYVIPLRLSPVVFAATMSLFFSAVNFSKWVPYALLGLLDTRNMLTSLMLLPLVPVGVFTGLRLAKRIDPVMFYRFIYAGMAVTGGKLVWDGFIGG